MHMVNFAFALILVIPLLGMITLVRWRHIRSRSLAYNTALLAFVGYSLALINLTLFPIPIGYSTSDLDWPRLLTALVPLRDISSMLTNPWLGPGLVLRNIGGNIMLFIPLGALLPVLHSVRWRGTILAGLSASICIESMQLFMVVFQRSWRTVSSDDVLLNAIGAVVGYWIFLVLRRVVQEVTIYTRKDKA